MSDHALADDPIEQLRAWLDEARDLVGGQQAMTLATATPDGRPSARVVLLRGLDEHGLTFFTNRTSRKGEELRLNPYAAVAIHWWELGRQVRVEGAVEDDLGGTSRRRTGRRVHERARSPPGHRRSHSR